MPIARPGVPSFLAAGFAVAALISVSCSGTSSFGVSVAPTPVSFLSTAGRRLQGVDSASDDDLNDSASSEETVEPYVVVKEEEVPTREAGVDPADNASDLDANASSEETEEDEEEEEPYVVVVKKDVSTVEAGNATRGHQGLMNNDQADDGGSWMCKNTCYTNVGFHHSDCRCDRHSSWYMWVCTHYQGRPIEVQFCGMHACGGCHAVPKEPETSVPAIASTPEATSTPAITSTSDPSTTLAASAPKTSTPAATQSSSSMQSSSKPPTNPSSSTSSPAELARTNMSSATTTMEPHSTMASAASSTAPSSVSTTVSDTTTIRTDAEGETEPSTSSSTSLVDDPAHTNASGSVLSSTDEAEGWMCRNTCYTTFGFYHSDCRCDRHSNWYMWVCTRYQGEHIKTQFCGSHSCGGCHAVPEVLATGATTPAPTIDTTTTDALPASTVKPPAYGYHPFDPLLMSPSTAPLMTFYMYRVQSDQNYPPENQNMASLGGALWYLHNEIVNNRYERRFSKTRIQRFKMTVKAPQSLFNMGMNFGTRYAFDRGQCTGPWDCPAAFKKLGYFVGCNNVDHFPTAQWSGKVFYRDAIWYSLPGKCSSKLYYEHDEECNLEEPGGACDNVTGQGNCTYSYESAGELSIDELENITSFKDFVAAGGWEYDNRTDAGLLMTFWNDKYNKTACDARMDRAEQLFAEKYPDDPTEEDWPAPKCDYNMDIFYKAVEQSPYSR